MGKLGHLAFESLDFGLEGLDFRFLSGGLLTRRVAVLLHKGDVDIIHFLDGLLDLGDRRLIGLDGRSHGHVQHLALEEGVC